MFDLSIYSYLEKTTTAVMIKYKDVSYLSCFNSVIRTIQNVFNLNLFFFFFYFPLIHLYFPVSLLDMLPAALMAPRAT